MATSTLTDDIAGNSRVTIDWTDAEKGANYYSYRLYHRTLPSPNWTLIYEIFDAVSTNLSYDFYGWANALAQEIVLVIASQNPGTGEITESAFTGANGFNGPASADYWIVHPTDPTLSVQLHSVKSAPMDFEREHKPIKLLGRGYKVNQGADQVSTKSSVSFRLLSLPARGPARDQAAALRTIFNTSAQVFIRNPFGDMWPAFIESLSLDPMANTGAEENHDGQLSWVEVN